MKEIEVLKSLQFKKDFGFVENYISAECLYCRCSMVGKAYFLCMIFFMYKISKVTGRMV